MGRYRNRFRSRLTTVPRPDRGALRVGSPPVQRTQDVFVESRPLGNALDRPGLPRLAALLMLMLLPVSVWAQPHTQAELHARKGFELARQGVDLAGAEAELRAAVALSPKTPAYLSALGGILAMQERFSEAAGLFERALEIDPLNLAIRRNLAASQWQQGELARARQNLMRILQLQPDDQPATLLLGIVAAGLKDCTAAVKLLESVSGLVRQRPEGAIALAKCYYGTDQRQKARELLALFLKQGTDAGSVFAAGRLAADANDYATAESLFASIRGSYHEAATLGYNIALLQYRTNRFAQSQQTLEELIAEGHADNDIYSLLGWSQQKQGHWVASIDNFQMAIKQDPANESNHLDLAMTLFEHKKHPAALSVLEEAAKLLPSSAILQQAKGLVETALGYYTAAVESYAQSVRLSPGNAQANVDLARAQAAAGFDRKARATLEEGINRFPQHAPHFSEYGRLLLKLAEAGDQGLVERAAQAFNRAAQLDESYAEPYYQLGRLALDNGEYLGAVEHLEQAARLEPTRSKVHHALARAYVRLGRTDDAARERQVFQTLKQKEDEANPRLYSVERPSQLRARTAGR